MITILLAAAPPPGARAASSTPLRVYAHRAVLARWHSQREWEAFAWIVRHESGWDPCAVNPRRHACFYAGSASCGLGQRQPCPRAWWGRLWATRRLQVWNTIHYIAGRYVTPTRAKLVWLAHCARGACWY